VKDSNVEAIRQRLADRAAKGLETYGVTTERDDLTLTEWLDHAINEALDFTVYLHRIKTDPRLAALETSCNASHAPSDGSSAASGGTTGEGSSSGRPPCGTAVDAAGLKQTSDPSAAVRADPGRPPKCPACHCPCERRGSGWVCREVTCHMFNVAPASVQDRPKPAAASAWEEFERRWLAGDWAGETKGDAFNAFVAAREKAAVEARGKLDYQQGFADGQHVAENKNRLREKIINAAARLAPKPDAGRAEGETSTRPAKSAGEVAEEVVEEWSKYHQTRYGTARCLPKLTTIITAAIERERGSR